MSLPLLARRRIFAAKVEATPYTAESLTATEAAMNIFDSVMEPQGEIVQREGQSAFSPLPGVSGTVFNKTSFKSELFGGGSTPLPYWATPLLKACGLGLSTATFTPSTGSTATATLGSYRDGTLATSAGAMGNFTLSGEVGKPVQIAWDFLGTYIVPTDTALPTPTYPTTLPPVFMGQTLTIGGTAYNILSFELAIGNDVQMREAGNQSGFAFGYQGAYIAGRRATFKATLEATLMATKNWYSTFTAGTTAALNLVIGATTNNISTITAPVMQLKNPPKPSEAKGKIVFPLEFDLCRSAAAGDDELSWVFT